MLPACELRIAVTGTQKKLGDPFAHLGRVESGEARVGTPLRLSWTMSGARISVRTTRRPICCTRRGGGGWARIWRRRAAGIAARCVALQQGDRRRHRVVAVARPVPQALRRGDQGPKQWQSIEVDADSDTYRWSGRSICRPAR